MTRRTRDQERAIHAYERVEKVPKDLFEHYKAQVNTLGPTVLRSGLTAALAFLERKLKDMSDEQRERASPQVKAAALLLDHLAGATLPGLEQVQQGGQLPEAVRRLEPLSAYMLATREVLHVALWLRRAVQARAAAAAPEEDEARRA